MLGLAIAIPIAAWTGDFFISKFRGTDQNEAYEFNQTVGDKCLTFHARDKGLGGSGYLSVSPWGESRSNSSEQVTYVFDKSLGVERVIRDNLSGYRIFDRRKGHPQNRFFFEAAQEEFNRHLETIKREKKDYAFKKIR